MISQNMKTAIVTGAYGAIGKAISAGLLQEGFKVIIVGRDAAKLDRAAEELQRLVPGGETIPARVDLSAGTEIEALAHRIQGPLHILVNNAATAPRRRAEAADGTEIQFAVNVLAYFRMTRNFLPLMQEAEDARIINVASYWAGGLDLGDPEFHRRSYNNDAAYRQSKQADRMLTAAFAERLAPLHITVNACHPGDVNSKLSNDLGFGGYESPEQGADTPVWLSVSPKVRGITGKYFAGRSQQHCTFMSDTEGVENLYHLCEQYG
jgi:NAD(P)-dependent dehydrogenase (short-subunit alcohol dehydrogenase family)